MSKLFDRLSEFLSRRKGLLPLMGMGLIFLNLVLQFILPPNWFTTTNLLLHFGIIIAIFGLMLAWAL
jgi:hypothetical protein